MEGQCILVEHVEGDCEKLVKGEVTPERLWLNEAEDVPESLEGPLRPVHARELAQVAKQLEESFGAPQDVEWVIYDDALHIVQSRPITAAFSDERVPGRNRLSPLTPSSPECLPAPALDRGPSTSCSTLNKRFSSSPDRCS